MKHKLLFGGAAVALLTLLFVTTLVAMEEAPSTEPAPAATSSDPLLRLLVQKGVITADEARFLGVGTAADQRDKLVLLLKEKGLLSSAEVDELRAPAATPATPALGTAGDRWLTLGVAFDRSGSGRMQLGTIYDHYLANSEFIQ